LRSPSPKRPVAERYRRTVLRPLLLNIQEVGKLISSIPDIGLSHIANLHFPHIYLKLKAVKTVIYEGKCMQLVPHGPCITINVSPLIGSFW